MCGRYSAAQENRDLAKSLGVSRWEFEFSPRYNMAPTQLAPVIIRSGNEMVLKGMHWGLIPSWAKDRTLAAKCINARVETVAEKPAYRAALQKRRCLVIADGFYEWFRTSRSKQPFFFQTDGRPFCMAGIWEHWISDEREPVDSFAIITQPAVEPVSLIHDRMPKVLNPDEYEAWLDPARFETVLPPAPLRQPMGMHAVSKRVNSSANEGYDCAVRLFMTCGPKRYALGQTVRVRTCVGGYPLPEGLPEMAEVKVLAYGLPHTVEYQGKPFPVFPHCIESGLAFQIGDRWVDEEDPEISDALRIERAARKWKIETLAARGINWSGI